MPLREIFTQQKSFHHPWIGRAALNLAGLHALRVSGSALFTRIRRARAPLSEATHARDFRREGILVVNDFLPPADFAALREEAYRVAAEAQQRAPLPSGGRDGFGEKMAFEGGFDRFDGASLNRFLDIDDRRTPRAAQFANGPRLAALMAHTSTRRYDAGRFSYYTLVHGDDSRHDDIQKTLHRDTFHSAVKAWYFVDPVRVEDGPFEFVPRSHRVNLRRLRWEYLRSLAVRELDAESKKGSFRIAEDELSALGLPPVQSYPVPSNTLIIADVSGFHRRGKGTQGAQRLSLYASFRPSPFKLALR